MESNKPTLGTLGQDPTGTHLEECLGRRTENNMKNTESTFGPGFNRHSAGSGFIAPI